MTDDLPGAAIRSAVCKDCLRRADVDRDGAAFSYAEAAFAHMIARGGSRSDRCGLCRRRHQMASSAFAVRFVDIDTVGPVDDPTNPTGPLGGLGPLPAAHELSVEPVTEPRRKFGMLDSDIVEIVRRLHEPGKQVLVVKAGTGTGKSTFMPFRLAFPPADCVRLTDNGPIIVTEPRIQATVGVANYVATRLCRSDAGPGGVVGYQAQGAAAHDASNRLTYATDGSVVNWLTQQRHANWGAVIIDEAHERSANIDLILAILKRDLPMYPHLKVIVTSATFDPGPIAAFFGDACGEPLTLEGQKQIGYFPPLYPGESLDESRLAADWDGVSSFSPEDGGKPWDLFDLTHKVAGLRAASAVHLAAPDVEQSMAEALGNQLVRMCRGLEELQLPGDIISFLPTRTSIAKAVEIVEARVSSASTKVCGLMRDSPVETVDLVTAPFRPDVRRVVVATNIAETSLTLDGFRFVVDTGLINSARWVTALEATLVGVIPHSKSGIRQRWGRVGRTMPGWVFPLYSRDEFQSLAEESPPGSLSENLESVALKAIKAGFVSFDRSQWPAASTGSEDDGARFEAEYGRATSRLSTFYGAIDTDGDLTDLGQVGASSIGSIEQSIAIENADVLNCIPETAVTLAVWKMPPFGNQGILNFVSTWPERLRQEMTVRREALTPDSSDAVDFALSVFALWEQADPTTPPWEVTPDRAAAAARWWLRLDAMTDIAADLRRTIDGRSSATRSQKYRPINLALADRVRVALSWGTTHFVVTDQGTATSADGEREFGVDVKVLRPDSGRYVSLLRSYSEGKQVRLDGLARVPSWVGECTSLMGLVAATDAQAASGAVVEAHAVRTHFPVGATLDRQTGEVLCDGFHRPDAIPLDHEGNFLDPKIRLQKRSSQFGDDDLRADDERSDRDATHAEAGERRSLMASVWPPRPEVEFSFPTDVGRSGIVGGYRFDVGPGRSTILVEPDLAPARTAESLEAADLVPGTAVDLVVGPSKKKWRRLIRTDGRGWFLVSDGGGPATQPVRQALDRHDDTFLSRLAEGTVVRGIVVPDRDRGNSVSLLPDLLRRVEALDVVRDKAEHDRPRRLVRARLVSISDKRARVVVDETDGLVSFSVKTKVAESKWTIPLELDVPFLIELAAVKRDPEPDWRTGQVLFPVRLQVPAGTDVTAMTSAGFEVRGRDPDRWIANAGSLHPDPAVWEAVGSQLRAFARVFPQFNVNSLALEIIAGRPMRPGDTFERSTADWLRPESPTWMSPLAAQHKLVEGPITSDTPDVEEPIGESAPRAELIDLRDECSVLLVGEELVRIEHDDGRTTTISRDDYRRDSRPLHWLRENG